jgi:ribosome-binding factor A
MTYRYTKPPTQRQLRVAESIRHEIANILLRNELNHTFFEKHLISVSEVRISLDLKIATAFMIFPEDLDKKALLKFFKELSPIIRKLISKRMNLRFAPEIRFAIDDSLDKAFKVEKLLSKIDL